MDCSSRILIQSMEAVSSKTTPFSKRTILSVDTLGDTTKVDDMMRVLGLKSYVVHSVTEVAYKDKVDAVMVDTLSTVSDGLDWIEALSVRES